MTPLRQRTLTALIGACVVLGALSARAQEPPDASLDSPSWLAPRSSVKASKASKPLAAGPSLGLGRSLGVLLLTAILGGSALYLRSKKIQSPKTRSSALRVVSSTKLGGRAQLVIAEVDGRKILLGVTDQSVRKLGWMDELPVEQEELAFAAQPRLVPAGAELGVRVRAPRQPAEATVVPVKRSFRDLLANAVGNLGRSDDESAAVTLAAETQDTFSRSAPRPGDARRPEARKAEGQQMIDLEGQAKGLLARLGDRRP